MVGGEATPFAASGSEQQRPIAGDQSMVRRYRAHLESKGLLRVVPDGPYNRYDLRPLIAAAVGLNRLQGNQDARDIRDARDATDAPAMQALGPRDPHSGNRAEMRAIKEVERNVDLDSISPYPLLNASAHSADVSSGDQPAGGLAVSVGLLSDEFGDDAPLSSLTRARTLQRRHAAAHLCPRHLPPAVARSPPAAHRRAGTGSGRGRHARRVCLHGSMTARRCPRVDGDIRQSGIAVPSRLYTSASRSQDRLPHLSASQRHHLSYVSG